MRPTQRALLPALLKGIAAKIYSIVFLAIVGISILTFQASQFSRLDLERSKETELKHLVELAMTSIASLHEDAKAGKFSEEEAKERAKQMLSVMRYNKGDYLWINDMDHKMVMHGTKPSTVGKDFTDSKDPTGLYLFQEFVKVGSKDNGGVVRYEWPRPGHDEPLPKMAFVESYAPWGWIVGTGSYIDDINALYWANLQQLLLSALIILVVIGLVSASLAVSITRPIKSIVASMLALAKGELNVAISHERRRDEIGDMSRALLVFRDNAQERVALEEQQAIQKAEAEIMQRKLLLDMADGFDDSVRAIIEQVESAAAQLGDETKLLAGRSRENSDRVDTISSAMEETSVNVETVAGASEEMTASIAEIACQVTESSHVSLTAVQEVKKATDVVSTLSDASQAIGRIVGLIQDIAEQTNLLALNATIEAARAGEAGRGFAVVASEVKELAAQTGKATEEISGQINSIQDNISNAVDAIGHVEKTIDKMTAISGTIAAAVEEQGAASGEISSNITMCASGSRDVSDNAEALNSLAKENGHSAITMSQNAHNLASQVEMLVAQVDGFLGGIRDQNDTTGKAA